MVIHSNPPSKSWEGSEKPQSINHFFTQLTYLPRNKGLIRPYFRETNGWYPVSHNHGSVENGPRNLAGNDHIGDTTIFHWKNHDYGTSRLSPEAIRPSTSFSPSLHQSHRIFFQAMDLGRRLDDAIFPTPKFGLQKRTTTTLSFFGDDAKNISPGILIYVDKS